MRVFACGLLLVLSLSLSVPPSPLFPHSCPLSFTHRDILEDVKEHEDKELYRMMKQIDSGRYTQIIGPDDDGNGDESSEERIVGAIMRIFAYTNVYVRVYVCVCIHIYMYIFMYIYIYICICIYMYIYICRCI